MSGPRGTRRVNPLLASRRVPISGQTAREAFRPWPAILGAVVAEPATELLACRGGWASRSDSPRRGRTASSISAYVTCHPRHQI